MEYLLRGDICYSENVQNLICKENAYLYVKDGLCIGVYDQLPPELSCGNKGLLRKFDSSRHGGSPPSCSPVWLSGNKDGFGASGLVKCEYLSGGG